MSSKKQFQRKCTWPERTGSGGPLPISKSSWWAGVKAGRYPAPVKLGPRITAWRVEDILALMEHGTTKGAEVQR